jgi:hypothetical protein
VDPFRQARRLVPAFEQRRAQVRVVDVERADPEIHSHAMRVAGLARLPGEIDPRVVLQRVPAQDDVP